MKTMYITHIQCHVSLSQIFFLYQFHVSFSLVFFRFLSSFLMLPGVVVCHQESQLKSLFLIQSRIAERCIVGREVILIEALAAA